MGKSFEHIITQRSDDAKPTSQTVHSMGITVVSLQSKSVRLNLQNEIFTILEKARNTKAMVLDTYLHFSLFPVSNEYITLFLLIGNFPFLN